MRWRLSFLRVLFAAVLMCLFASACSSIGTSEGGAAETVDPSIEGAEAHTEGDGHDHDHDGDDDDAHGHDDVERVVVADGTDDSNVLSDPTGEFADATIETVISECAAGVDTACGQLGGRLADFDSMSAEEQDLAVCTAGPMLDGDGNGRTAAILTLSIAFADDSPSVIEPIEAIRTGTLDEAELAGAVSSTLDFLANYCSTDAS